jgi:hypothetical protein
MDLLEEFIPGRSGKRDRHLHGAISKMMYGKIA